jgi:hypothetical protein
MSIREAFFSICDDAKPRESHYVSLYVNTPYYGGPEEGGWWGSDTHLVAYQEFRTEAQAELAKDQVQELAKELNADAKRSFGEQCLREMEWCEARGLDADYLPEVDGEESYSVVIEEQPGSMESRGCRHYE